jgi:glycosyltransferase involved in cell wall biosynthesis
LKSLKIAFVVPWYGKTIGGGAEAECRHLVEALREFHPEVEVEVISTTLKEFAADWNKIHHKEGLHTEDGVQVRRFNPDYSGHPDFGYINIYRLAIPVTADLHLPSGGIRSPLTPQEEQETFLQSMVNSSLMYKYLEKNKNTYDFFVFLPYMFATTIRGVGIVQSKAIVMPCLHDERYAYLNLCRDMMQKARSLLFFVNADHKLANRLYKLDNKQFVLGAIVDKAPKGDGERFRAKFDIQGPFLIYAGRKIAGKNLPMLVDYFLKLRREPWAKDLKLVIIGKGDLDYSGREADGLHDIGFVSVQDKFDAFAAADLLCQPSQNESFSIVMMEAWLQDTPCLVYDKCDVTVEHCERSGGGKWFGGFASFSRAAHEILGNKSLAKKMGSLGREYVTANYQPKIVVDRFVNYLTELKAESPSR